MSYTLKDIAEVVAAIRRVRPDADFQRSDYDYGLSVRFGTQAFILFQPSRLEGERDIITSVEEAESIAFYAGEQWTADEISKMATRHS